MPSNTPNWKLGRVWRQLEHACILLAIQQQSGSLNLNFSSSETSAFLLHFSVSLICLLRQLDSDVVECLCLSPHQKENKNHVKILTPEIPVPGGMPLQVTGTWMLSPREGPYSFWERSRRDSGFLLLCELICEWESQPSVDMESTWSWTPGPKTNVLACFLLLL